METQPTLGFQRVIQRAILHVQSSGKKKSPARISWSPSLAKRTPHAVYYLHQQNISRLDVVNYISHGISKQKSSEQPPRSSGEESSDEQETAGHGGALENYTQNLNQQATAGKIDPLIGRDHELERVIQILCRRRKTTRCWSARPAWAKPPLPKAWRGASCAAKCRTCWPTPPSIRWTWARCVGRHQVSRRL